MLNSDLLLLLFMPQVLRSTSHSGVQRVVVNLARGLAEQAEIELVTWDDVDGAMRFYDETEMRQIFGRDRSAGLRSNPRARAVGLRFQDLMPPGQTVFMLFPEISYHLPHGWSITQRVITQCLETGWRTAAVLYDLIPIQNDDYQSMRLEHERYVAQLLRLDAIVAISHHIEAGFRAFLETELALSAGNLEQAGTRIGTAVLPGAEIPLKVRPSSQVRVEGGDIILLLGAIEPRKQQVRVLRCYRELLEAGVTDLPMYVIGSLHPAVAEEFQALIDSHSQLHYAGYMSDEAVAEAFVHARFSVFASCDEGFGLPITESLSHGVPCLTANFGAMAEVAAEGGCLTVDVNDDAALTAGLRQLATSKRLLAKLRAAIAKRPKRDWADYTASFLAFLSQAPVRPGPEQLRALIRAGKQVAPGSLGPSTPGLDFRCVEPALEWLSIGRTVADLRRNPPADLLLLRDSGPLDAALATMPGANRGAVPGWIDTGACPAETLADAVALRTRQITVARRERNASKAFVAFNHPAPMYILSIVISTYNRALFLAANVAWIADQIAELYPAVELVVVDNASTDDSVSRLAPLLQRTGVRLVVNPGNVGMLGNLRVCSSLLLAEHVWLIGDDDFIMPGVLHRILRTLSVHPHIPLVLMNFGVYHRAVMTPGDSGTMFMAERQVLALNPAPDGVITVIAGGSEHDNLFTAIYPIIFRADLAAAVFNHPFTGAPFRSLTESIPTTKFILGVYALADAFWIGEPCIVGNAHNSWQRYRVAWHAVLMPLALRLARRSGMDAAMLHRWSTVHLSLFEEAQALFPTPGLSEEFDADALTASYHVLGRHLLTAETMRSGL